MSTGDLTGLVMTGGGARAAYQVGALQALAEITAGPDCPFRVVTGVSAGAINAFAVALGADRFPAAVGELSETWRSLSPDRVFRTDLFSLLSIGARWVKDLASGGLFGPSRSTHLLDTAPLRRLLEERLPAARLKEQLASGRLHAVAVSATNYHSGSAVTFYESARAIAPWARSNRLGRPEKLTLDHIMASAAIPLFFPPVSVDGALFGDGCVRMSAPLSPAIHLGAERIVAIGIRYCRSAEEADRLDRLARNYPLTLADIGGVLLNAVFLDSLESDLERLERINATLSAMSAEQRRRLEQPLRKIPILALRPSRDLGRLAVEEFRRFPRTLRYFLSGIGATGERGWDLLSYLAFERSYIEALMDLGYHDTRARRSEIEGFLGARALAA